MSASVSWFLIPLCFVVCLQSSDGALYSASSPIVQLDTDSFYLQVQNSNYTWIVEFYASWCGHCQKFAPVYNQFSQQVQEWRGFHVAAVDCAEDVNRVVCFIEDVWGYPSVRFYPPGSGTDFHGDKYNGTQGVSALMRGTINYLTDMQTNGRELSGVPRLFPYRNVSEIEVDKNQATFILIVTSFLEATKLPQVIIMDLSDAVPSVKVTWMLDGSSGLRAAGKSIPSLYRLHHDSRLEKLTFTMSRLGIEDAIRRSASDSATTPTQAPTTTVTVMTKPTMAATQYGLYMQDLVTGLYYTLFMEVGMMPVIEGEALSALKTHIRLLAEYHPGETHIVKFLKQVNRWLAQQNSSFSGEQWHDQLQSIQSETAYIPEEIVYVGCAGSDEQYRGCPCALWQTFHALTVNAFIKHKRRATFDPKEIPLAMRGYIRHFFRCRHCAEHFVNATTDINTAIRKKTDGILWLWQKHNEVNHRLHGAESEDPHHPKVQFPTRANCGECRKGGATVSPFDDNVRWNKNNVRRHLIQFYKKSNIITNE